MKFGPLPVATIFLNERWLSELLVDDFEREAAIAQTGVRFLQQLSAAKYGVQEPALSRFWLLE